MIDATPRTYTCSDCRADMYRSRRVWHDVTRHFRGMGHVWLLYGFALACAAAAGVVWGW